jgi:hypothetical protein
MHQTQTTHMTQDAKWFACASSVRSGALVAVVRATKINPGKPVVLLGVTNP